MTFADASLEAVAASPAVRNDMAWFEMMPTHSHVGPRPFLMIRTTPAVRNAHGSRAATAGGRNDMGNRLDERA
jgi:hypothetical protein